MSFVNQILRNWQKYQVPIILLIFLFIILTFYQLVNQPQEIEEHFTEEEKKEDSNTKEVYFIRNLPPQDLKKIWETQMGDERYISFWERKGQPEIGYYPIGQIAFTTDQKATKNDISVRERPGIQYLIKGGQKPIDFTLIWDNQHQKDQNPLSIWRPTPPEGYVAMGDVAVAGYQKPETDLIHCPPIEVVEKSGNIEGYLWKDPYPKQKTKDQEDVSPHNSFSLWEVGKEGFFFGRDSYQRPDNRKEKIYHLKDSALQKEERDPKDGNQYLEVTLQI